jgi:hypothetical protein
MQIKTVFVNDVRIGEASTWGEVEALLAKVGIWFVGKPGAAEGPTAFFIFGSRAESRDCRSSAGRTSAC